jgi:Holliday junction resolvasome RuvABC endonuclease subunit
MAAKPVKYVDGGLFNAPSHEKIGDSGSVYVGIDQSLTGFAVTAYRPATGDFYSWVYTSPEKGVTRLLDLQHFMENQLIKLEVHGFRIVDVAMEAGVYQSVNAAPLGELAGAVKLWLARNRNTRPLKIPPTMVKKFATGKGNAKKNEVMLGVYKRWKVEFADDNMADSYVLARICAAADDAEKSLLVYQIEVARAILATPEKFRDS